MRQRRPTRPELIGAAAIDLAILLVPPAALGLLRGWTPLAVISAVELLALVIIVLACTGRTPGLAAIGARVVTAEGSTTPGLGRAAARVALPDPKGPSVVPGGSTPSGPRSQRCRECRMVRAPAHPREREGGAPRVRVPAGLVSRPVLDADGRSLLAPDAGHRGRGLPSRAGSGRTCIRAAGLFSSGARRPIRPHCTRGDPRTCGARPAHALRDGRGRLAST